MPCLARRGGAPALRRRRPRRPPTTLPTSCRARSDMGAPFFRLIGARSMGLSAIRTVRSWCSRLSCCSSRLPAVAGPEPAENLGLFNLLRFFERTSEYQDICHLLQGVRGRGVFACEANNLRATLATTIVEHLRPVPTTHPATSRRARFQFVLPDPHCEVLRAAFCPPVSPDVFHPCRILTTTSFLLSRADLDVLLAPLNPRWFEQQNANGARATVSAAKEVKLVVKPVFVCQFSHAACARCAAFRENRLPCEEHTETPTPLPTYFCLNVSFLVDFSNF